MVARMDEKSADYWVVGQVDGKVSWTDGEKVVCMAGVMAVNEAALMAA
jgi:hypothetical protein